MREQHLSDEAVAAFADGVLSGHARERARRHTSTCTECAHAVSAQREAVFLLRAAPAPSLPTGLFDRLVQVPATTPIHTFPTALADDGSTMFAAFGTVAAAAFVPAPKSHGTAKGEGRTRHVHPLFVTTAAVAAAGVLTVASASSASGRTGQQQLRPASSTQNSRSAGGSTEETAYFPTRQHAQAR